MLDLDVKGDMMRILLVGDFSSFHKYLKCGLIELGHDVTLVSSGDGWKKIGGADIELYLPTAKNKIQKVIYNFTKTYHVATICKDYDVVQFINPRIFHPLFNGFLVKKILRQNKFSSLVSCGNDLALNVAHESGLLYNFMMDYDNSIGEYYSRKRFWGRLSRKTEKKIINQYNVIIPTSYEYILGYQGRKNVTSVIPMPVDVDSIEYIPNKVEDRIVIFHGITREKAKGTMFIRAALEKIKKEFGEAVEIIVDGHMPFDKYVEIMKRANIVIDQCCSYGYGINADIALAQGKVVLSGARREAIEALGVHDCPVFNIEPDENQIYHVLKKIILNKEKIPELGEKGRKYIENVHGCKKIAAEYLKIWKRFGAY